MVQQAPNEGQVFPEFRSRSEFEEYLSCIGYRRLDRLHEAAHSTEERERLAEALRAANPDLNGQLEGLIDHLILNDQELQRKESFLSKALKLPGHVLSAAWDTVKNHPVLTGTVVLVLLYFFAPGFLISGFQAMEDTLAGTPMQKVIGGLKAMKPLSDAGSAIVPNLPPAPFSG